MCGLITDLLVQIWPPPGGPPGCGDGQLVSGHVADGREGPLVGGVGGVGGGRPAARGRQGEARVVAGQGAEGDLVRGGAAAAAAAAAHADGACAGRRAGGAAAHAAAAAVGGGAADGVAAAAAADRLVVAAGHPEAI